MYSSIVADLKFFSIAFFSASVLPWETSFWQADSYSSLLETMGNLLSKDLSPIAFVALTMTGTSISSGDENFLGDGNPATLTR